MNASSGPALTSEQQLQAAYSQLHQQFQQQQQELQNVRAATQQLAQQQQLVSSNSASSSSSSSSNRYHRVKIAPPPFFRGSVGTSIDQWFRQVEQQLQYYGMGAGGGFATEVDEINFAAAYFQGAALTWWTSDATNRNIQTWQQFKQVVLKRFQPIGAGMLNRQRLSQLKQGGRTVTAYAEEFQNILAPITDMSETDKVFNFLTGLTTVNNLRGKVMQTRPLDLISAISTAVNQEASINMGRGAVINGSAGNVNMNRADAMDLNMLHDGAEEESGDQYGFTDQKVNVGAVVGSSSSSSTGSSSGSGSANFKGTNNDVGVNSNVVLAKLVAMEQKISAISTNNNRNSYVNDAGRRFNGNRSNGLSQEERDRLRSENRCFRCKERGHIARYCPNVKRNSNGPGNGNNNTNNNNNNNSRLN